MPIYGYGGVNKAPWIMVKEMKVNRLLIFMKVIKQAESIYSLDQVFLHSIEYNKKLEDVYIAKFDASKTSMDTYTYQTQIEKLIKKANDILIKRGEKSKWYNNYKFDIMGTFTTGKIILMTKNKEAG